MHFEALLATSGDDRNSRVNNSEKPDRFSRAERKLSIRWKMADSVFLVRIYCSLLLVKPFDLTNIFYFIHDNISSFDFQTVIYCPLRSLKPLSLNIVKEIMRIPETEIFLPERDTGCENVSPREKPAPHFFYSQLIVQNKSGIIKCVQLTVSK